VDQSNSNQKQKTQGRWKMLLVVAICASPLIASYFTYYVIKPESRTNYGDLIDPRNYPIPELKATQLDGSPASLEQFRGKWIMLQIEGGECAPACRRQLLEMRQLRLMQGKEMERIERVWLITDDKPLDTVLMKEFDGTAMLRVQADLARAWLPVDAGSVMENHLYLIDPLGHLMMRFPKDPDPSKVKKDLSKLLRASAIG